ncbi:sirohydrochlorin cobaltochelatase [Lacrimispora sp.]|uniref:sirohydrochlorin cobaltochelatase n=1 Tax=Lacrimispora sp. TaxID=2719234 RepID=UPI003991A8EC
MGKSKSVLKSKAILVVSFGTSYRESLERNIGAVERSIAASYPDYEIRRAFTSQMIIDKIRQRDGDQIDNMDEAMRRLINDGFDTLIIQPTHVMSGSEYDKMMAAAASYEKSFISIQYGEPLLNQEADYDKLIRILAEETSAFNKENTALVFMGHGTEHDANVVYDKLNSQLKKSGYANYYIGTVEATPTLEDVLDEVKKGDYQKAVLFPLMIVAGDHANNDMAGDEEESWKTAFISEGYQVECVLKGMGEYKGVQQMFLEHINDAMKNRTNGNY